MTKKTKTELAELAKGHPAASDPGYHRWRRARVALGLPTHHRWRLPDQMRRYMREYMRRYKARRWAKSKT